MKLGPRCTFRRRHRGYDAEASLDRMIFSMTLVKLLEAMNQGCLIQVPGEVQAAHVLARNAGNMGKLWKRLEIPHIHPFSSIFHDFWARLEA